MLLIDSENAKTRGRNFSRQHPGLAINALCLSLAQQREFELGVIIGEATGMSWKL
jgi:hypothetical protein